MNENEASQSFEALMAELKKTVESLEKGDLPLEDSMKAYEQGVTLVRGLEKKLSSMEGRLEEILADGSKKELSTAEIMANSNDS
jgi:exodeoxyribonuclease VII small subunit